MKIVIFGLSLTSSWGNGHATTYRALVRGLEALGHQVTFLERDVPWYASNRDAPRPKGCRLELYESLEDLRERFTSLVQDADAVVVGSYVPDGAEVTRWVVETARGLTLFYDIDTPITLEKLRSGESLSDKERLIHELLEWLIAATSVLHISDDVARFPHARDRLHALLQQEMARLSHQPEHTRLFLEYWALGLRKPEIGVRAPPLSLTSDCDIPPLIGNPCPSPDARFAPASARNSWLLSSR